MSPQDANAKIRAWSPYWIGGVFALAAFSQARVQITDRESLLDVGEKSGRFVVTARDPARRGSILASDGRPLAQNEDACEFGIVFSKVPDSDAFFIELSQASGIPASEMRMMKESGASNAFWPDPLSRERMKAVQKVKTKWRADGVSVGPSGKRTYALGEAAAGFLGYLRNGEPAAGLELSENDDLKGVDGVSIGVTDRAGAFLPMRMDSRSSPRQDGKTVTLTIDGTMQLAAASALKRAVESNRARQGAAVVLDPKTGDILAMANWPSLDPERVGEPVGKDKRVTDFNPNYMAALEPGSMFKVLTLALALDEGAVSVTDTVYCQGAMSPWPKHQIRCDLHHGTRAHGSVHPINAIARSCNLSAAIWALKIGHPDFTRFLDDSGLMAKTHVGLPLEAGGSFKRDEYAKRLQLATMGFGQSLTCTPLSLASSFSALANGGVRMEPRLIAKVGDKPNPVKTAGRLFTKETSKTVLGFMEAAVETKQGTGYGLRIPGYRLGGKTGTAEKVGDKTGGYVSNFVGMVPADDPKVVILVMVDRPSAGKYYGALVAGPVFQDIARAAIRRYAIPRSTVPSPLASRGGVRTGVTVSAKPVTDPSAADSGPNVSVSQRVSR